MRCFMPLNIKMCSFKREKNKPITHSFQHLDTDAHAISQLVKMLTESKVFSSLFFIPDSKAVVAPFVVTSSSRLALS